MENILTPEFRGAFIQVFRAKAQKQEDGSMGAAKFTVRAAFPPNSDMTLMKKEASEAAQAKWADKPPKTLRSPFRKNEELDKPVAGVGDDWIIMTFSSNEDRRPGVVDAKLQDIIDESQCYSGAWYRAQVRAYAYDKAGNKGVSFGLQNLQKLREQKDTEAAIGGGGGGMPASKAFTAVETDTKAGAGALFD